MSEKVRVGHVGTSWWADSHHLPGLKSHPGAEVAAICGRNKSRAEKIAGKYEIPQVFTDYREMIEKAGLDVLIVVVPDEAHYPITMDALDAGLNVLCEKPLARSLEQAKKMYDKAEAAGVRHMTYFTWRWLPHYRYVKSLIDEGYIGKCYHCHFQWFNGLGRGSNYWWRFDRERADGMLGDIGSHMIDLARLYLGDIAGVSARLGSFVKRQGPEGQDLDPANDSAMLTLDFENGADGLLHVSAVAHTGGLFFDQRIILHGESGSLEVRSTSAGTGIFGVKNGENEIKELTVPDRFWENAEKGNPFSVFSGQSVGDRLFIDAVIEDRPVNPGFYEGLKVQEVIEAANESHRNGSRVSI